jgi:hypothetical protein
MEIRNNRQEEEIEKLVRTLKNSKIATSESDARRMAEEMLGISRKVASDFAERERKIYGDQKQSHDVDVAHKQMELLASNMGKGKSNVRLGLDEIDVEKPLRDLVKQESEPVETDEDDAVELVQEVSLDDEPEQKTEWAQESPKEESVSKIIESDVDSDDDKDDDSDENPEDEKEEKAEEKEAPAKEASEPEAAEESGGEDDFSVKELETPPANPESRKKEIESMEESSVDLSNMFNVNK